MKNPRLPVTLWMNIPSYIQDGLWNTISATNEIDLQVIFARELTNERKQLGWQPQEKKFLYHTLRNRYALAEAMQLARAGCDRLHIVNGIWAEPAFASALITLAHSQSRFLIYSEAPDPHPAATGLKKLLRNRFGQWVARRAAGLLAVSHFAAAFYAQLGVNEAHIYPFGYFRSTDNSDNEIPKIIDHLASDESTEMLFVGQFVRRKGIDILLEAIAPLCREYPKLKLTLIGTGEEEAALRRQADNLRITKRVSFIGAMPSDEILRRIAQADALILPSRWDGWGMVVNEALAAGLPVIVSDRCGAADLIQSGVNGFIFRSGNIESLRDTLRQFLNSGQAQTSMRSAARVTGEVISAEVAAPYLIDCLNHVTGISKVKPVPPWSQITFSENAKF